eukprot:1546992-Pleurochrysis_carterae.AAC.1
MATLPPASRPTQEMTAAPLFSTPPLYGPRTTNFERALSNLEIEPLGNFETLPQIVPSPNAPLPKSWYTIIGGPFEGVRFAKLRASDTPRGARALKLPCFRTRGR